MQTLIVQVLSYETSILIRIEQYLKNYINLIQSKYFNNNLLYESLFIS